MKMRREGASFLGATLTFNPNKTGKQQKEMIDIETQQRSQSLVIFDPFQNITYKLSSIGLA
jgi:hypothetical protein